MAHIGFPIVGDVTYANDPLAYRMFLHAAALELPLSRSGLTPGYSEETPIRASAPLAPLGWKESFLPLQPVCDPEGWPGAARVLAAGLVVK